MECSLNAAGSDTKPLKQPLVNEEEEALGIIRIEHHFGVKGKWYYTDIRLGYYDICHSQCIAIVQAGSRDQFLDATWLSSNSNIKYTHSSKLQSD